jgi:hypothetical protein
MAEISRYQSGAQESPINQELLEFGHRSSAVSPPKHRIENRTYGPRTALCSRLRMCFQFRLHPDLFLDRRKLFEKDRYLLSYIIYRKSA